MLDRRGSGLERSDLEQPGSWVHRIGLPQVGHEPSLATVAGRPDAVRGMWFGYAAASGGALMGVVERWSCRRYR